MSEQQYPIEKKVQDLEPGDVVADGKFVVASEPSADVSAEEATMFRDKLREIGRAVSSSAKVLKFLLLGDNTGLVDGLALEDDPMTVTGQDIDKVTQNVALDVIRLGTQMLQMAQKIGGEVEVVLTAKAATGNGYVRYITTLDEQKGDVKSVVQTLDLDLEQNGEEVETTGAVLEAYAEAVGIAQLLRRLAASAGEEQAAKQAGPARKPLPYIPPMGDKLN